VVSDDADFLAVGRERLRAFQSSERNDDYVRTRRLIARLVNRVLDRVGAPDDARMPDPDVGVDGLPDEEPGAHALLARFVTRAERATRRMGVRPLPAVAVGIVQAQGLSPRSSTVFGASAVIAVPGHNFLFAHLLSKAMVPLICRLEPQRRGLRRGQSRLRLGASPRPRERAGTRDK
jgi:hypothetical protein